jgi:hypothetical protein
VAGDFLFHYRQSTGIAFNGSQSGSVVLAYPQPVLYRSLLVLAVGVNTSGTITVTDSQGNFWPLAVSEQIGTLSCRIYYAAANAFGAVPDTVKVTLASPGFISLCIAEYTHNGLAQLDQTGVATANSNAISVPVTTHKLGELYVGAGEWDNGNVSIVPEVGWQSLFAHSADTTHEGLVCEALGADVSVSGGLHAATWQLGGNVLWKGAIATFNIF